MLNQYDTKWKNVKLGTSTSTLGNFGCNLTCICQALIDRGYDFTPATLNTRFTNNKSYREENLIAPATIASTNSDIFLSGVSEAWNDANVRKYLADKSYFVVCEVSAQGIGGTGQHFVLLRSLVEKSGVITNSYIGDPWGGLENLTSVRYKNYGYIKSLRVYKVKIKQETESTTMTDDQKGRENGKHFLSRISANINASPKDDFANMDTNGVDNIANEVNTAYNDKNSLIKENEEQKSLLYAKEAKIVGLNTQVEQQKADFEALEKSSLEEKQVLVATAKDTLDKQAADYTKKITDLQLQLSACSIGEKEYTLKELLIKTWNKLWERI